MISQEGNRGILEKITLDLGVPRFSRLHLPWLRELLIDSHPIPPCTTNQVFLSLDLSGDAMLPRALFIAALPSFSSAVCLCCVSPLHFGTPSVRGTEGRRTEGRRARGDSAGTGPGSRAAPKRVDGARFRIEGEGERRSIRFRRCGDRTQETNTKGEETKMLSFSHEGETQKRTMRTICVAGHRHGVPHL